MDYTLEWKTDKTARTQLQTNWWFSGAFKSADFMRAYRMHCALNGQSVFRIRLKTWSNGVLVKARIRACLATGLKWFASWIIGSSVIFWWALILKLVWLYRTATLRKIPLCERDDKHIRPACKRNRHYLFNFQPTEVSLNGWSIMQYRKH